MGRAASRKLVGAAQIGHPRRTRRSRRKPARTSKASVSPDRCTAWFCWTKPASVIRPALIWCDQRSQKQVDAINAKVGKETVLRWIANPVLTGFTLPKLLWVRDNEPQHFERVRQVLLPKDYVRYRLTGDYASDVSDATGTALFDVVRRQWSYEMV